MLSGEGCSNVSWAYARWSMHMDLHRVYGMGWKRTLSNVEHGLLHRQHGWRLPRNWLDTPRTASRSLRYTYLLRVSIAHSIAYLVHMPFL